MKKGLDYFPLDVNIFDHPKVAAISGEFQMEGEIVLIKLLCAVYRNGYFYEWSDMNRAHLLRQLPGLPQQRLDRIVERLVQWGVFDKELFQAERVLTSVGIQERYFTAIVRRKVVAEECPYLLINVGGTAVNARRNTAQKALPKPEKAQTKVNQIKTPLNLPDTGSVNQGFAATEGDSFPPAPDDGIPRNYWGLTEFLTHYRFAPEAAAMVIRLSNYGEIGHPVWKLINEIRCNSKIKMPQQFLLARLRTG